MQEFCCSELNLPYTEDEFTALFFLGVLGDEITTDLI
jgi:hypothetical protein